MRILYLDGSGDPGRYVQSNTKHFVLCGIAAKPKISHELSDSVRDCVRNHFESVGAQPSELHYVDLIQKRYPYNLINPKELADDVFDIISKGDISIFAVIINKETHFAKYVTPFPVKEFALDVMTTRFQKYLERVYEYGLMVHDDESNPINKSLIDLFEEFKTKGTAFIYPENVLDTLFFAKSDNTPMLQLADFCAYAFFSKYERDKIERYDQISNRIDTYGEKYFS